ncbi:MAG: PH domain-containing protein [Bacteroidia bacterium]|nr:PH domain-containing protein [Bacteroidia bacterium]
MKTSNTKRIMISSIPVILILAGLVLFMMAYWPTGITVDQDNNITLGVALGKGRVIPADEITITEVPENLLSSIIRTNGMSLGKLNYGKFKNTKNGQKMFLYLTGKENIVCFEYDGVLYVVDDWRTNP